MPPNALNEIACPLAFELGFTRGEGHSDIIVSDQSVIGANRQVVSPLAFNASSEDEVLSKHSPDASVTFCLDFVG